ncbi:TMS membrane protein/tumor differentially expressed protein [Piromyces finnis]|uniref:TMS membrane protein/tumor differentially expressed protein n=1 Tax=Piromyces finnis TaxID=1754191 RepID=A0A1Y1V9D7_9FUNG|nr:TMS membrane protein/tumor differentially expressed protein [Piromyces finnis]|eukprot:ORX50272.1 TMS membrane protein/tumor differentially expressed protein [Piromyces finnis]
MTLLCSGSNLVCCAGCTFLKCLGINKTFKSSVATRIAYAGMLLFTSIASWLMLVPYINKKLGLIIGEGSLFNSECKNGNCYGILAIYRICFASSTLHLILSILMIGVTNSKNIRGKIQNGFWGPKMIIWFLSIVLSFFVHNDFFIFWSKYIAIFGSVLFMLIQLVILIDFSYSWVELLIDNYENTDDKKYMYFLIIATFSMLIGAVILTIVMYVIFGKSGCSLNKVFISINLVLCILITIISILPEVQYANPQSGIAQASIIVIYSTYIVCSAISNEPDDNLHCNPFNKKTQFTATLLGVLFTFISIAYSTTTAAVKNGLFINEYNDDSENVPLLKSDNINLNSKGSDNDNEENEFSDDEKNNTTYNYSFFHLIFALAGMYIAMLLTDWSTIKETSDYEFKLVVGQSWFSVWVKIITSWLAILLYLWTVVAPIFFPDNFSF